ncbi:MAG TPA: RNA-binding domain-containing protein [Candidatus Sulfotelmatobacter sp.]|nr:RNA-binding domain-containing protein [Candidatus Sulfotelmatobacter sp.]
MAEITLQVETEVNPTEDVEKVKAAVLNLFANLSVRIEPQRIRSILVAEAKTQQSLENFQAALRRDRVRAAARKLLHSSVKGNTISFYLNKQVAFVGHVSFSNETGECPLGPLKVVIETENPRELIDWLAPRIA